MPSMSLTLGSSSGMPAHTGDDDVTACLVRCCVLDDAACTPRSNVVTFAASVHVDTRAGVTSWHMSAASSGCLLRCDVRGSCSVYCEFNVQRRSSSGGASDEETTCAWCTFPFPTDTQSAAVLALAVPLHTGATLGAEAAAGAAPPQPRLALLLEPLSAAQAAAAAPLPRVAVVERRMAPLVCAYRRLLVAQLEVCSSGGGGGVIRRWNYGTAAQRARADDGDEAQALTDAVLRFWPLLHETDASPEARACCFACALVRALMRFARFVCIRSPASGQTRHGRAASPRSRRWTWRSWRTASRGTWGSAHTEGSCRPAADALCGGHSRACKRPFREYDDTLLCARGAANNFARACCTTHRRTGRAQRRCLFLAPTAQQPRLRVPAS